jgi:hypothetical protein
MSCRLQLQGVLSITVNCPAGCTQHYRLLQLQGVLIITVHCLQPSYVQRRLISSNPYLGPTLSIMALVGTAITCKAALSKEYRWSHHSGSIAATRGCRVICNRCIAAYQSVYTSSTRESLVIAAVNLYKHAKWRLASNILELKSRGKHPAGSRCFQPGYFRLGTQGQCFVRETSTSAQYL